MGERLSGKQIEKEIITLDKILRDSKEIAGIVEPPVDPILSRLGACEREAVEWALENARLQGRLEAYKHVLDEEQKPVIGNVEQLLRNGDIEFVRRGQHG